MQIISPHRETGWITAIIQGRWVQAKVYDEASTYGVNNGRVSKLAVGKNSTRDPNVDFFSQICYNYDRGLDYDHAPKGLIEKIVAELETLPKLFPQVVGEEQITIEKQLNNHNKSRFKS